ncbi:MAG: YhdH/YhfP family quinone oxidoreductase, partial [Bacteroidota bacterium]
LHFRALRVNEKEDGRFQRAIETMPISSLPPGELLIRVHYAALNYKDALSASGNKGVTRHYPHTPGIDAAGIVEESTHPEWKAGQAVIVTSYDLGMNTDGGFGEYIRVPAAWAVPLPAELSLKESMIIGTAGFTAALGLWKMERIGQQPDLGPLVVTGASGGVGSLAVGIMSKAGYEVIAISGKDSAHRYLTELGASRIEPRSYADDPSSRPLRKPLWAGGIDTVGGNTLATLLKSCDKEGSIATCGLVGSSNLALTVFPFILNGVNLLGIDSATIDYATRVDIWGKLSREWRIPKLEQIAREVSLEGLETEITHILAGKVQGRILVKHA